MAETTNTNASVELLKAKLEAQKKDKLVHLLAGLVAGLVVGFFGANWLNANPAAVAPAATQTAAATASGELPHDHPPVEGEAAGGAAAGAAMPEVTAKLEKADSNPKDVDAQLEVAAMFHRIQNYDKAIEYLGRAQALRPDDVDILISLANTTTYAGKYAEALPLYEKALKARPNSLDVFIGMGVALFELGNFPRAQQMLRDALRIDPKHEFALQVLAEVYVKQGDAASAEATLNQLATVSPQSPVLAHLREDLNTLKTTGKIPTH